MSQESSRGEELLARTRANLAWLLEDGYRETKLRVRGSQIALTFAGPHGQVRVWVYPGYSEIEIWLTPKGNPRGRRMMQTYLEARGLPAPHPRIDATSTAAVDHAVDEHTAALKQLRHKELAGDWTLLEPPDAAAYRAGRQQLIDQLVAGAKRDQANDGDD